MEQTKEGPASMNRSAFINKNESAKREVPRRDSPFPAGQGKGLLRRMKFNRRGSHDLLKKLNSSVKKKW
jgi:hypothetical protein